jgi:hypothetical protein
MSKIDFADRPDGRDGWNWGAVLDHRTAAFRSAIAGNLSLGRAVVGRYVQLNHGKTAGLSALAAVQAQTLSYAWVMQLFAWILLAVIPIVFLARVQKPGPPPPNV